MKKRSAAAAVIAALILIMSVCLSGCGTKTLLSENDPVTLEFWHVYGEQSGSPMNELVDEFNRTEGMEKGIVIAIRNMMDKLKMTAEQAMDTMNISKDERSKYEELLKQTAPKA